MKIPPLPQVECAVLHETFRPMEGKAVFKAISELAAKHGFGSPCNLMVSSTEKDIHVLVGAYRILVSQNSGPLGLDGFRNALSTPFTGMVFPNARAAVEGHRANTFITVGKGPVSIPEEMLRGTMGDVLAEMSAFTTSQEAVRAMRLCQDLTLLIIAANSATAVHWCVSDNLLPQAAFEKFAQSDDLTLLNVRPYLTSSAGRMGPGLPVGVTGNGSQWLVGKMVAIEEAPVPLEWLLPALYGFVNVCIKRGALIPDKDTFSVEGEDWQIGVFHEKIENFDGWELVRLKILHHPKYGIRGKVPTKRTFEYKSVDDMRQRALEERTEVRAANDVPAGERNDAQTSPARASGDMARLRNLAVASAANQQKDAERPSGGGIASRLRSLFSGKPN